MNPMEVVFLAMQFKNFVDQMHLKHNITEAKAADLVNKHGEDKELKSVLDDIEQMWHKVMGATPPDAEALKRVPSGFGLCQVLELFDTFTDRAIILKKCIEQVNAEFPDLEPQGEN